MLEQLQKIGLSRNEALVYVALLELKKAMAGEVSQKTGLHRRSIYEALKSLEKKGIVFHDIKENNKYFIPNKPEVLLDITEKKEKEFNSIVPNLRVKYEESKDTQITNFFKGEGGFQTILDDMIIKGKDIKVIGNPVFTSNLMPYFKRFDERRVEAGLKMKFICSLRAKKNEYKIPMSEYKYLAKEYFSVARIYVYANKVAIILYSDEPLIISIKIPEITESYDNYFKLLWTIAK